MTIVTNRSGSEGIYLLYLSEQLSEMLLDILLQDYVMGKPQKKRACHYTVCMTSLKMFLPSKMCFSGCLIAERSNALWSDNNKQKLNRQKVGLTYENTVEVLEVQ